jgi:hypothetical protein
MNEGAKLAVLIDADNASASVVEELLQEVAKFGTASIKRAYGDWTTQNLVGWKEHLHRHAIQPIQQFAYTTKKNSTDASLIIDAMDLLYAGNVDGFCLVSSDSDFTPKRQRWRTHPTSARRLPRPWRPPRGRTVGLRSRRWALTWPRTILRSTPGSTGPPSSANWCGNSRTSRSRSQLTRQVLRISRSERADCGRQQPASSCQPQAAAEVSVYCAIQS